MKSIARKCGVISIIFYILCLHQLWHLCQYGGLRSHLPILVLYGAGFLCCFCIWLFAGRCRKEDRDGVQSKMIWLGIAVVLIGTVFYGGRTIYSAIPYHGALSWKIDEWHQKKEVTLVHNNFFQHGVEGMLSDLDETLEMPEELYVANSYQMTFDQNGRIETIYTFLYGKDENGETRSYLINYDASQSEKMTVWVDGAVNASYDAKERLAQMLLILQNADCRPQVNNWTAVYGADTYEILYYGYRSFNTAAGLHYLAGDANGDGTVVGPKAIDRLKNGGEVAGYEVSLHIPSLEEVTPVRYIMEPEYISPESIQMQQEAEQIETSAEEEGWTVDNQDGTMYFFLSNMQGWRLVVTDAAAGSRFYVLERTQDGGRTWIRINQDPFDGNIGVTEGLLFFDKKFGFAGLTGASQDASRIFMTADGGETFTQVELPMDMVTELPVTAEDYGQTLEDFDYLCMPEQEGDILTIKVLSAAMETDGLVFQSLDQGVTWEFAGAKVLETEQ